MTARCLLVFAASLSFGLGSPVLAAPRAGGGQGDVCDDDIDCRPGGGEVCDGLDEDCERKAPVVVDDGDPDGICDRMVIECFASGRDGAFCVAVAKACYAQPGVDNDGDGVCDASDRVGGGGGCTDTDSDGVCDADD